MAKISHGPILWPFSLYFKAILGQKCVFQRQPFPLEFRAGLYVFGIRKSCRMGAACKLIKIPTFCFYAPPSGGGGCLNVNLLIGFGPFLGLALWPRAKPINRQVKC